MIVTIPEKALYITKLANLKYFLRNKYQRIYWGVEFCQNLIPDLTDTQAILKFVKKENIGFTLITPFVTESGLERLNRIFHALKKEKSVIEIVINDWGVLGLLDVKYKTCFDLILGRLLTRQCRDLSIIKVLQKQPPLAIRKNNGKINLIFHRPPGKKYQEGMRASWVNSSLPQKILSHSGINRIELNNLIQGLNVEGLRIKKSVYTPYINISTTRFCPMNSKRQKIIRIGSCNWECQKYYDILRSRSIPKVIYKRGNTTFYENHLRVKEALPLGIDRIVFQPELPF